MRPGRSTILKIDRAVMLLPHPLSPTTPSVAPGYRSKLTPSPARTVPSSCVKYVLRFRTDSSGARGSLVMLTRVAIVDGPGGVRGPRARPQGPPVPPTAVAHAL